MKLDLTPEEIEAIQSLLQHKIHVANQLISKFPIAAKRSLYEEQRKFTISLLDKITKQRNESKDTY